MGFDITIWQVFLAGLLQLISPSLLPAVPFFVGYMVIASVVYITNSQVRDRATVVRRAAAIALFFFLGFASFFVGFGSSASNIGQFLGTYHHEIAVNRGQAVFSYGLYFLVLRWFVFDPVGIRLKRYFETLPFNTLRARLFRMILWLYDAIVHSPLRNTIRFGFALLMGLTMSVMWVPVVGPVLAAVLVLAANEETIFRGIYLLAVYVAGMVVPLFVLALLAVSLIPIGNACRRWAAWGRHWSS